MKQLDLKAIRKKYKVTQVKLSELTGYPQGFISQMENGREAMPKQFIDKVAKALGISDITPFLIDNADVDMEKTSPTITNSVVGSGSHLNSGISDNTFGTMLQIIQEKDVRIKELSDKIEALKDEILDLKLKLQATRK